MIASSFVVALLGLAPAAMAGPLDPHGAGDLAQRQAAGDRQAILDSIGAITKQLAKTNNTVSAFNGGGGLISSIQGLTNVNSDVVALGKTLTTTTDLAKKTQTLNVTDS